MDQNTFREKLTDTLFFGGISREAYKQVEEPVAQGNQRAFARLSGLAGFLWCLLLLVSINMRSYRLCRPVYFVGLISCAVIYLGFRLCVRRWPKTLALFICCFRLSLLGAGIGIAVCQNERSLFLFTIALLSPAFFIDSTPYPLAADVLAVIGYVVFGKRGLSPEVYSWGLDNLILFSVFGLAFGNIIDRERFERYVYEEAERKLIELRTKYAYCDQMTGLQNRRAYAEKLDACAENMPAELCIVMADLNGLKKANDTLGHEAGDELIIGASECLTQAFDPLGTVYRIGGDEFCVVMETKLPEAERCLARLAELTVVWKGKFIDGISISCGAASREQGADLDALVEEADRRMYEDKDAYYARTGLDRRTV